MKKALLCSLVYALVYGLLILFIPMVGFLRPALAQGSAAGSTPPGSAPAASGPAPSAASSVPPAARPAGALEDLLIWDSGAKQLLTVPVRDYLIGAVASEMPPDWPEEALKAQAVAAHSYALYQRQNAGPDAAVTGYFSADPARRQGFMTDEVLRSYWGSAYEDNLRHISGLVDQVLDQILTWQGQPAAACYHAISCGTTEASQNVWSEALPYLQGVESPLDLTSPDYEKSVTYTSQQMYDALTLTLPELPLEGTAREDWFGPIQSTPSGYVRSITVAGQEMTGPQLRQILGLRSACFTLRYQEGVFTVTTKGYGHGVGLSQFGAAALARTGKSCAQILSHYYPGTQLQQWQ